MRVPRGLRLVGLAGLGLLATCDNQQLSQLTEPTAPAFQIMDAAHDAAANPDFFFLPPLVPDPRSHEDFDALAFDGQQNPAVEICALSGDACGSSVASYTMTTGHGSEVVRVNGEEQHYLVNWHSDEFSLDPAVTYRIIVSVAGTELGFADVDVASSGNELKNVDTGQYIALKDGRTLPIKFRIEQGAVYVVDAAGATVTPADGKVTLDVPGGALSEPVGLTVIPASSDDPNVVSGSVFDFGPDGLTFAELATLTITYDEAELPPGTDESLLFLYKLVDDMWYVVPGSTVDQATNRVTASIDGFSYYSVRIFYELLPHFTVNSTADPGAGVCDHNECTLREAIASANTIPGHDNIWFSIPGDGRHTIQPLSALPSITDPVTIDGYTQPGATPNTNGPRAGGNAVLKIELDGRHVAYGLRITAGNSVVRGLVVNSVWADADPAIPEGAIVLESNGNTVKGSYIGTNISGTEARGNFCAGVLILSSDSNVVGGTAPAARNVISGSLLCDGVRISGGTDNSVLGNLIGTDVSGTSAIGNEHGVGIFGEDSYDNTIGGATAGARNVISGNAQNGVRVFNWADEDTVGGFVIQGNYIGTIIDGTCCLGNGWDSHRPDKSGSGIWVGKILGRGELGGVIADNIVAGSHRSGILIGTGFSVEDNYVFWNGRSQWAGVEVSGDGNSVRGNTISTNGAGVVIRGNLNSVADNTISESIGRALLVTASVAFPNTGNQLLRNSIHTNPWSLGIDLAQLSGDGVTPNDPGDTDVGANDLQNFPVLTSAQASAAGVWIAGTLNSRPNWSYRVEFFDNGECDPSGYGEGERFIGFTIVTTDGIGNATFNAAFAEPLSAGRVVTATATDNGSRSTSEFSACVEVTSSLLDAVVSHWPGDGNFQDVRGSNHLTPVGDVPFVAGIWGQAFSFTGIADHANKVGGATGIDGLQTLTLQAWVKLDGSGPANKIQRFVTLLGEKAVIRQDGINAPRQLHFYMNFGTPEAVDLRHVRVDGILQTECFRHVVGTYDGATMRAYLDGVEVGNTPIAGTVADGNGVELSFGATSEALHGTLDEVMVFDRALEPTEIQNIYNAGPDRDKCGPPGG